MPGPHGHDGDYHPAPYVPCSETKEIVGDYCPITELHAVPRFSLMTFSTVSSDFPSTFDPVPEEYASGVAFYPSLVLLMSVIFSLLCFFYTCCCARCSGRGKDEKVDKVTKRGPLIALLITLVIFAGSSGVGGYAVQSGLGLAVEFFDEIVVTLDGLAENGQDLSSATEDLTSSLAAYAVECPAVAPYQSDIDEYAAAISEFTDEATDFPELLDGANEQFKTYSIYAPLALALPIGLVMVQVFLTTFGCSASCREAMCTCRCLIFLSNFLGMFTMLLLGLFCSLELGFGIFFSDFCIDPNAGMFTLAEAFGTGSQVNITEYYVLCEGSNPMGELLAEADNALSDFKTQLEATESVCGQSSNYDSLVSAIDESQDSLASLMDDASCANLNPHVQDLVYSSYCERFVPGVAGMAFSMLFTMIFLLPVVITSRQFAERIVEEDNGDQMELVGVDGNKRSDSAASGRLDKYAVNY